MVTSPLPAPERDRRPRRLRAKAVSAPAGPARCHPTEAAGQGRCKCSWSRVTSLSGLRPSTPLCLAIEAALCRRHTAALARIDRDSGTERTGQRLEASLSDVVVIAPIE